MKTLLLVMSAFVLLLSGVIVGCVEERPPAHSENIVNQQNKPAMVESNHQEPQRSKNWCYTSKQNLQKCEDWTAYTWN